MPGAGAGAGAAEQFYSEPEPEPEPECFPEPEPEPDQKCHGSASLVVELRGKKNPADYHRRVLVISGITLGARSIFDLSYDRSKVIFSGIP